MLASEIFEQLIGKKMYHAGYGFHHGFFVATVMSVSWSLAIWVGWTKVSVQMCIFVRCMGYNFKVVAWIPMPLKRLALSEGNANSLSCIGLAWACFSIAAVKTISTFDQRDTWVIGTGAVTKQIPKLRYTQRILKSSLPLKEVHAMESTTHIFKGLSADTCNFLSKWNKWQELCVVIASFSKHLQGYKWTKNVKSVRSIKIKADIALTTTLKIYAELIGMLSPDSFIRMWTYCGSKCTLLEEPRMWVLVSKRRWNIWGTNNWKQVADKIW